MRLIVFMMIAGTYMLSIAASAASAAPIFQFYDKSAFNPGHCYSCPIRDFLISLDNPNNDKISLQFSLAKGRDAHVVESKMVSAGMFVLQSGDVAELQNAGKQLEDLLIPLFAGSLLIGLSGFLKMLVKKQPLAHHAKAPARLRVSYEKTLWAESNGLM
jgi:hypothetical protein